MSKTFDAFLEKQMENPIFKAEYDALEPEYDIATRIFSCEEYTTPVIRKR